MPAENRPRKIIVHHTADPSPKAQLEKVNLWHQKKYGLQSATGSFVGLGQGLLIPVLARFLDDRVQCR